MAILRTPGGNYIIAHYLVERPTERQNLRWAGRIEADKSRLFTRLSVMEQYEYTIEQILNAEFAQSCERVHQVVQEPFDELQDYGLYACEMAEQLLLNPQRSIIQLQVEDLYNMKKKIVAFFLRKRYGDDELTRKDVLYNESSTDLWNQQPNLKASASAESVERLFTAKSAQSSKSVLTQKSFKQQINQLPRPEIQDEKSDTERTEDSLIKSMYQSDQQSNIKSLQNRISRLEQNKDRIIFIPDQAKTQDLQLQVREVAKKQLLKLIERPQVIENYILHGMESLSKSQLQGLLYMHHRRKHSTPLASSLIPLSASNISSLQNSQIYSNYGIQQPLQWNQNMQQAYDPAEQQSNIQANNKIRFKEPQPVQNPFMQQQQYQQP